MIFFYLFVSGAYYTMLNDNSTHV